MRIIRMYMASFWYKFHYRYVNLGENPPLLPANMSFYFFTILRANLLTLRLTAGAAGGAGGGVPRQDAARRPLLPRLRLIYEDRVYEE
jgi:hypothetical protein